MSVSVFGLWHLGCVTSACVAEAGQDVAIDANVSVIERRRKRTPPLFKPGLAGLLQQTEERLQFTTDLSRIAEADVLWVCHDTPVDEEDRADVAHVVEQVNATFPYLREGAVALVSAQLPVIAAMERASAYLPVLITIGTRRKRGRDAA
jgi:UDPglucose 6-dehydrogenase